MALLYEKATKKETFFVFVFCNQQLAAEPVFLELLILGHLVTVSELHIDA